ncbi:hypothetical protein AOLI_G00025990 [Acnodon oligacanthus]
MEKSSWVKSSPAESSVEDGPGGEVWNGETRRAAAEGRAERTRRTRRAPGGKRGFIPAWEPQRRSFYTHSFRPQSSELSTGAALMCTVACRGVSRKPAASNCELLCNTTLCLYLHQSVSIMNVTLLVLIFSVVAMMVTCDLQLSERGAGTRLSSGTKASV